jgi:hypothetical protein
MLRLVTVRACGKGPVSRSLAQLFRNIYFPNPAPVSASGICLIPANIDATLFNPLTVAALHLAKRSWVRLWGAHVRAIDAERRRGS